MGGGCWIEVGWWVDLVRYVWGGKHEQAWQGLMDIRVHLF